MEIAAQNIGETRTYHLLSDLWTGLPNHQTIQFLRYFQCHRHSHKQEYLIPCVSDYVLCCKLGQLPGIHSNSVSLILSPYTDRTDFRSRLYKHPNTLSRSGIARGIRRMHWEFVRRRSEESTTVYPRCCRNDDPRPPIWVGILDKMRLMNQLGTRGQVTRVPALRCVASVRRPNLNEWRNQTWIAKRESIDPEFQSLWTMSKRMIRGPTLHHSGYPGNCPLGPWEKRSSSRFLRQFQLVTSFVPSSYWNGWSAVEVVFPVSFQRPRVN